MVVGEISISSSPYRKVMVVDKDRPFVVSRLSAVELVTHQTLKHLLTKPVVIVSGNLHCMPISGPARASLRRAFRLDKPLRSIRIRTETIDLPK
ncbi:hypothetical protein RRG08_043940 [Elysia crispata]|uniref:Uncharacterized protein n=1 Tax=Elysia crispata TaxID=231223 RepID=A0AAE0Y1N7_9GAST|nr:hypothetical protein RRG08_043940 [Elysia crispata]